MDDTALYAGLIRLYVLHRLERKGYLRSTREREGSRVRRTYVATADGRKALVGAKVTKSAKPTESKRRGPKSRTTGARKSKGEV